MQGWFKLMHAVRQSDPPTNQSVRYLSNSTINRTFTNGESLREQSPSTQSSMATANERNHVLRASQSTITPVALDSPPNIFDSPPLFSSESTPIHIIDDILAIESELLSGPRRRQKHIPSVEIESTTASCSSVSTDSRQSTKSAQKNANKSHGPPVPSRLNDISTPITEDISDDDDMPIVDIRKQKIQSIDTLSTPSTADLSIPLATDLQSLPGHVQDEQRDHRFLIYNDIDTLSMHLHVCLYVDKQSLSLSRQSNLESQYNVLNKIFKIYYIKTFRKLFNTENKAIFISNDNDKIQPLSVVSSPTSTSFKTDWNVNRRNSTSTQRQTPRNFFHILQLNPKKDIDAQQNSSLVTRPTPKTAIEKFESIKDILARTYYPHRYTAIECGYYFGEKSKFLSTQQLISTNVGFVSVKEMPQSPEEFNYDSTTITLKSPPTRRDSVVSQPSPVVIKPQPEKSMVLKQKKSKSSPAIQAKNNSNGLLEELSPWMIKESVVILTPTKIPVTNSRIEKEKPSAANLKRKAVNTNGMEIKKKRVAPSILLETANAIEDISESSSDEDVLPSELPKQCFIKNGLRSNYYKTNSDDKTKPKSASNKSRLERRRQSSGSLPPFYTGIYEASDDMSKASHTDFCLPYDIFWHSQQKAKQPSVINAPVTSSMITTTSDSHQRKKKSSKPKQKLPSPYKKITRNVYSDQLKQSLLVSYNADKVPVCDCKPSDTCEDGVCVNKLTFTECSSSCACGAKCTNQKIRKVQWCKHLEVFDTGKYGQGVRATAPIPKGTFICEYVGEVVTNDKFQDRMVNLYSKDEHHYAMKLTQNLVIDAYRMGSIARFANHSCSPNCEFEKWTVDGLHRMCMFSLRPIKAGEELTYDYNFKSFNLQAQQPCYCDSSKCRGKIGGRQQTTPSSSNIIDTDNPSPAITPPKISQRDRRMILQSSLFLLRNLKKQKTKRTNSKSKIQNQKQSPVSLFHPQNYYHPNGPTNRSTTPNLRRTPKIEHKDMFSLFYNHIRHSHFVKTGRHYHELIDDTCYYAQLAQLTLILNEILDLILYYKCLDDNITPAEALKQCPSKRLYPVYYEIITKPIDLKTIKVKLDHGDYSTFERFEQDILLLFQNAITYCGANSTEANAVLELQEYFTQTLKSQYKSALALFHFMLHDEQMITHFHMLESFIERLHEKEVRDGQIRQVLYEIIYNISDHSDDDSPIAYKIVLDSKPNSHRPSKSRTVECIMHCRCGSVFDENSLVQCYACQLWQHVACVSIVDSSRPYYCFECQPMCEKDPSACLKTNVLIAATLAPWQTYDDNHSSYSTLTRSDGLIVRTNECYFVPKQDETNIDRCLTSPEYDILFVERLWIDDHGVGQVAGFYYIRPNETFHEPSRKFFPNEVFRFPSSNEPLPISSIVRPCFVMDMGTYCRGKPISDNNSRVSANDLFICEFRVDKMARTFTRLVKSRHLITNTKSYCFDRYVEKLAIKRDYQPYEKEVRQHLQSQHDHRRRLITNSTRSINKKLEERRTRIQGIIEKIYCRCHNISAMPNEVKYTIHQLFPDKLKQKTPTKITAERINKKRRTISVSSDDEIVELVPEIGCETPTKRRSVRQSAISPQKRDEISDLI
ncbi:unnamed protein product [Adineta ricciae]|uniref:Histone-lysine N-methyltransferase n=1 Tax=Adineta ricciae TaxID=249248 RepID=A0A813X1V4_ADIRI|nr:unnamed protein product [Adineta ricciae]CAF1003353.1 unnamed protein product [Adineta ricciae]